MSLIAVDLAAKFSAAVWMTHNSHVRSQWDSWQKPEWLFIDSICRPFDPTHIRPEVPDALIIEDLPARVPWMTTVKDVCRLQGRIVERMAGYGHKDKIVFVQPAQWREHYGEGLKRGTGPNAVVGVAARFGYLPPPLESRMACGPNNKQVAGEKATVKKVYTDYCAAYLIGRWAVDYSHKNGNYDAPRTTRYQRI